MGKQDSDTKEDFHDVFEFAEVFDLSPVFCYAADRDEWKAAYVSKSHLKSRA